MARDRHIMGRVLTATLSLGAECPQDYGQHAKKMSTQSRKESTMFVDQQRGVMPSHVHSC